MKRTEAAVGTTVFFFVAPVVVAGVIPWAFTMWTAGSPDGTWVAVVRVVGGIVLAASVAIIVHSFVRFVVEGRGTPAPVAPTERLVVGGLYRYVRNPMYVGVVGAILGQALLFARPILFVYGAVVWMIVASFVRAYEEPTLARQFGAPYAEYRRNVRAWLPRLTPWRDPEPSTGSDRTTP